MKKFLIITAVVAMASLVQAATVQWKVAGTAENKGQTVYLVLAGDVPASITSLDDITGAAFASGTLASAGRGVAASGTTETTVAAGETSSYTIYFIDTASNSYLVAGTGSVTAYGESDPAVLATAANPTYTAPGGAGWVSLGAVPEPTTIALLALGLAAVGLKRKVA